LLKRTFTLLAGDLLHLVYPNLCAGCQLEAVDKDEHFCIACETQLPLTDFHKIRNNEAMDRMIGGFPFTCGVSMFRFYPGGMIQNMIHQIKYRGQTNLARKLGRRYGELLRQEQPFHDLFCIIPVPLHPSRLRIRGYNQSWYFADGLASSFGIKVSGEYLCRVKETTSQTSKSRFDRLKSMTGAFRINARSSDLIGRHVLLVDDVLTTGSTLEACAQILATVKDIRISFATIALAQ
jgi:ComF family protein